MGKFLTFNDGASIEVLEASTIYDVIIIFNNIADLVPVWSLFTRENMAHGHIGDQEFFDIVPLDVDLIRDPSGAVIARFESRDKTNMEYAKEQINKFFYVH